MHLVLAILSFVSFISLWFSVCPSPASAQMYSCDDLGPDGVPSDKIKPVDPCRLDETRQEWLRVLGTFPPKVELAPEVLSEEDCQDHLRRMIRYTTEKGCRVEAFLLLPKQVEFPAPAALVFHSTSSNNILQPVGLADAPSRHLGLHMVRRGYVVLCPRNFIFGYGEEITMENLARQRGRGDFRKATETLLAKHPKWTGMGKMVWDGMRALDYLESLPEVDASKIVTIGHSLGGKEALFIHAFDNRISAAVSSEGGAGLALSNWGDIWYLGDQIRSPAFQRDLHELMAMGAPRPLMIIGGESEDGHFTWPYVRTAAPAYTRSGQGDNLVLLLHKDGHTIEPHEREIALKWLNKKINKH